MKPPKPIIAVWDDAEDKGGWLDQKEVDDFAKETCLVVSLGYVIKKTKKYITIAGDIIKDKEGEITYGRVFKVPRQMVKSIKQI